MNVEKIGLVTLHKGNYGSVLQCFALKETVQDFGYKCEVLELSLDEDERYISKICTLKTLIKETIAHPSYVKMFIAKRNSGRNSINSLSDEAKTKLDVFEKISIAPKKYTLKYLNQLGELNEYKAFITGSDQVWNGVSPYQPFYFLEFAKDKKKIAYAPSFGGESIAPYNEAYFKKQLNKFDCLSVRENYGVEIVEKLTGHTVERMPDPTILRTNAQWDSFAKTHEDYGEYVFVHFLDRPNENALSVFKLLYERHDKKIIVFSYPHEEFDEYDILNVNGDPSEYVGLIKQADYVLTDSFHTLLFALRYNRQTYVFERQYFNGNKQSSRIESLLENTKYTDRLIKNEVLDISHLPKQIHDIKDWLLKEQRKGLSFLQNALGNPVGSFELKGFRECTGCGLCSAVCPIQVIKLTENEFGYSIPTVDEEMCIHCNKCVIACNQKAKKEIAEKKRAYVAYNKDTLNRINAASGGIFAGLAQKVIESGGVVSGASLWFEDGSAIIEHIVIDKIDDLERILKSKYVQSDCTKVYATIKEYLESGTTVLFGGTSCQVEALYKYLRHDYNNLYTVDLICHGVPGQGLFKDYIRYIEKKHGDKVVDYSFRKKENGRIRYIETVKLSNQKDFDSTYNDSLYCKMFLNRVSYREKCYDCSFASMEKPASITVGDFFDAKTCFPEMFDEGGCLANTDFLSCLIVNGEKGNDLIDIFGTELILHEVPALAVQMSHEQLCTPSKKPNFREKFFKLYSKGGFENIERYYHIRDSLLKLPRKMSKRMRSK